VVGAHQGNSDTQYISNTVGAGEYAASYSSKQEAPDSDLLQKLLAKKFAQLEAQDPPTGEQDAAAPDRARLRAVGQAVLECSQVGSVQACYTLLGLPFVICEDQKGRPKVVDHISTLERKNMHTTLQTNIARLEVMQAEADNADAAAGYSVSSQLGRRDAYAAFVEQQRCAPDRDAEELKDCNVTFSELFTHYGVESADRADRPQKRHESMTEEERDAVRGELDDLPPPPFIKLDSETKRPDWRCLQPDDPRAQNRRRAGRRAESQPDQSEDDESDGDEEAEDPISPPAEEDGDRRMTIDGDDAPVAARLALVHKFRIDDVVYVRHATPHVLAMSPYIKVNDEDARSAYATLLWHTVRAYSCKI
jgi:hypothetical protein